MDRYEFRDAKAAKFWEIEREGACVRVRYGAIGKSPRTSEREFPSEEEAEQHRHKQIQAKLKKGYVASTAVAAGASPPRSSGAVETQAQVGLADRFAAMVAELHAHPDVRVDTLELWPPKSAAEVEARLAESPFAETTRRALSALYTAIGGLEISWQLLRADPALAINPAVVTGEATLLSLDEVLDNSEYIEMYSDMDSPEGAARVARLHPISLNEEGYATAIDLDAEEPANLREVANDSTSVGLSFGVREWVERLLLCRGTAGFAPVSDGLHSGGTVLRAVIEGIFGEAEAEVSRRLPRLEQPCAAEPEGSSLLARSQRIFTQHGLPVRVVEGWKTDACEVFAIFGDDFADFEGLNRALGELFSGSSKILHLGVMIGKLSIIAQSSWDLGHYSSPAAYWSLIDEQLQGSAGPEEVAQRYAWIVDRTRDRFDVLRRPEQTRELATNLGDLATALNGQEDPELRELAWCSVTEWKSVPELCAEAQKSLKDGAARVVEAIEAHAAASA